MKFKTALVQPLRAVFETAGEASFVATADYLKSREPVEVAEQHGIAVDQITNARQALGINIRPS